MDNTEKNWLEENAAVVGGVILLILFIIIIILLIVIYRSIFKQKVKPTMIFLFLSLIFECKKAHKFSLDYDSVLYFRKRKRTEDVLVFYPIQLVMGISEEKVYILRVLFSALIFLPSTKKKRLIHQLKQKMKWLKRVLFKNIQKI